MSNPLLLIDTDVFLFLAASGLLHDAIALLGFDLPRARRLEPLDKQLRRGRSFLQYPEAFRRIALDEARTIAPLRDYPNESAAVQELALVEAIHPGEAFLFAVLAENPGHLLATGDKTSLIALATAPNLRSIRDSLAGRIACLETVVLGLLRTKGAPEIAAALTPLRSLNVVLQVVLSLGIHTPGPQMEQYLGHYIRDLEEQVGTDFLFKP